MSESRVFIVQEAPGKNILSAADFGKPEVLLPPSSQVVFASAPTVRRIRQKLHDYSDQDFILAIGDPCAIGITCAIAASINSGRFKILKWDRQEGKYYAVAVKV